MPLFGLRLQSLLKKDLEHRRELLREHFTPVEGQFAFAKSRDIYAVEEIQAFLDESIKDSCEGLMVKMMQGEDATYEPSRRSMNWLKVSPVNATMLFEGRSRLMKLVESPL